MKLKTTCTISLCVRVTAAATCGLSAEYLNSLNNLEKNKLEQPASIGWIWYFLNLFTYLESEYVHPQIGVYHYS